MVFLNKLEDTCRQPKVRNKALDMAAGCFRAHLHVKWGLSNVLKSRMSPKLLKVNIDGLAVANLSFFRLSKKVILSKLSLSAV